MPPREVVRRPLLVLGGSGFLGAHVLRAAGRRGGAPVFAASRSGAEDVPEGVRHVVLDLAEPGAPVPLLDLLRPRAIVLAAALARAGDCERDPERARVLNAEVPARVAGWCAAQRARLVHVSTDLVFGGGSPPPTGHREDDPVAPLSVYGETKAAGERAVLAACPSAVVARLPLLFGDSFGRGVGASDALTAALERGEDPLLFTDEWRTPLAAEDAAAALLELAGAGPGGDARRFAGRLHVAGPDRLTRLELGRLVLRHHPRGASWLPRLRAGRRDELPGAERRARDVALDASLARELLVTRLRGADEALGASGPGARAPGRP